MYINILDKQLDNILNDFNLFLNNKNIVKKIQKDVNFVKFQNDILELIKNFYNILQKNNNIINKLKKAVDNKNIDFINGVIKRYLAYYIFLSIGYNYRGGRDLYITNIIEIAKNQKNKSFSIPNFFNSENNSKIISYFSDIKNILGLLEFKTMDRIKIIINNAPLKYERVKDIIKILGEDYFETFFLIKNNNHNIIKTFIVRLVYLLDDREEIIDILNQKEKENSEYKYIEIVLARDDKLVDFNIIQDFLAQEKLNTKMANDMYEYLENNRKYKEILIKRNKDFIDYLLTNRILVPISQEFLRYHKDNYKYDVESLLKEQIKQRDATKIKYIINKINKVKNLFSKNIENNASKKKEIYDFFYKHLEYKKAILYNDNEEIKIINKLELSDKTDDIELLVDLENIRKYCYINYKEINGLGIKIRPSKEIEAIRNTNLLKMNREKSKHIETRMGNNNLPIDMVGIAYIPNKKPIECFKTTDLVDVKKLYNDKNGFTSFIKLLHESINKKEKKNKIYYWKFDINNDEIVTSQYKNITKKNKNYINMMLEEIYFQYFIEIKEKINNIFSKKNSLTIWYIKNILDKINNNILDLKLNPTIYNNLDFELNKLIPNIKYKLKETEIIEEKDIIKLPIIKQDKNKEYFIKINIREVDNNIDLSINNNAICHHYLKWISIMKISKKMVDIKNQAIFDFVKTYVRENSHGEYICKSCGEMLKLKRYVFEGTYVKELDIFLTTSLAIHQKLEEIPKYIKYNKTIKNIHNNLERISSILNLNGLLGSSPAIILRRKMIIQNIIDTILLNTQYIRNLGTTTKKEISNLSNINLSNVIFFNLEDSIFVSRSDDIDKLKILKHNNIMAYLILFILCDLNQGIILSIKENKKFNYFIFDRIKENLFGNIKIRIDEKSNIQVINLPVLSYVLYMLASSISISKIWLDINFEEKKIPFYQKIIIQTVVDLFNIILNAYFSKDKKLKNIEGNYLYEILAQKFMTKIKTLYNDKILNKILKEKGDKNIKRTNNKISFITKKVKLLEIPDEYNIIDLNTLDIINYDNCLSVTEEIETNYNDYSINYLDEFTNCSFGDFHDWKINDKNDLTCTKCKIELNNLIKKYNNTTSEEENTNILEKLKLKKLLKLTKTYCLDGKQHKLDENKKCKLCKLTPSTYKYSNNELLKLEKNLENNKLEKSLIEMKKIKEKLEQLNYNKKIKLNNIEKINKKYIEFTKNNLRNYITNFVDKLIKISGNKIKIKNKDIYLNITKFIIKNDLNGKRINKPIEIFISKNYNNFNKDLQTGINKYYHPEIKKIVYIFYNRKSKYYMYYDCNNLTYLGYSNDIKKIKKQRSKIKLIIELSIKEKILNLGLGNLFLNLVDHNYNFLSLKQKDIKNKIDEDLIKSIIRKRVINLKQIIKKTINIIQKINNINKSLIKNKSKEIELILEFKKIIKFINLEDEEGSNKIFKYDNYIMNYTKINNIILKDYNYYINPSPILDLSFLENINNYDSILIFFLIYNLNKLLNYNKSNKLKSIISYLIIRIIEYNYNEYKDNINNLEIQKFRRFLYIDQPYMDDYLRVEGIYNELVDERNDKEEINDFEPSNVLDVFDIDDYEDGDPDDEGYMEALNYDFD